MGWSNLIYIIIGVGIGVVVGSLWQHWRLSKKTPREAPSRTSNDISNSTSAYSQSLPHCQEQLQQTRLAYHMAVEMCQFKAGFLARVAHELRSPLNGMIGMNQLILNGLCDTPEEEREFLEKAHESALKLMKFIDDMVIVSKTEHGTDRLQIQPIELEQVFREVYDLTRHQAANRNLKLEFIAPDSGVYILADQRRFRQVLVHLVDSAINQTLEGKIVLSAKRFPDLQQVTIDLEDQRSQQAWAEPLDLLSRPSPSNPPTAAFNGKLSPGLTLLVNKLLLELMHGSLEIVSVSEADGDRTYLQCTIPLAKDEVEA